MTDKTGANQTIMGHSSHPDSRARVTVFLSHFAAFLFVVLAAFLLRRANLPPDTLLHGYLQVLSGLLAFVFSALVLVRFQGTQDRISLILGAGFLLSGAVLTATSALFFQFLPDAPQRLLWAPFAWWLGRIILALFVLIALLVEHFIPRSRHPRREIAGALATVIAVTYVLTAVLHGLPPEASRHPSAFFPSPQQLIPGGIFLVSLFWYRRRLAVEDSPFDRTMYAAIWLNAAAQFSAAQSGRLMDAPFVFAQVLMVLGYTVALGGALLDNARLFERVRHMAVSDPLTGLANYRRLLDVLENETERTDRTGRPFAVLLLDLDGLKVINDSYGHLVGSRAICRVGDILRIHCRAIDTAARYGGDEFALVLPESQEEEAQRVAGRIREVLANDDEPPRLSASIGVAVYRGGGERIEKLLSEADQDLYTEKAKRAKRHAAPLFPRRTPKT
ncbi:MAG TPA: GGDEF domain-containing protein [Candidatus Limnocylindrales bacterium]|nr:GGDEF domain-containing protein [Candidatus Limnocylindrales bacterium]